MRSNEVDLKAIEQNYTNSRRVRFFAYQKTLTTTVFLENIQRNLDHCKHVHFYWIFDAVVVDRKILKANKWKIGKI